MKDSYFWPDASISRTTVSLSGAAMVEVWFHLNTKTSWAGLGRNCGLRVAELKRDFSLVWSLIGNVWHAGSAILGAVVLNSCMTVLNPSCFLVILYIWSPRVDMEKKINI